MYFPFSTILEYFCAFLQPKLPQPKNCKNPKKSHFFKKWSFSENALNMIIWSNIVGKWPQRCLKTFFNVYMTFRIHFMQFLKNRKKSILKIFCWCMHQQIWPKFIFPAEYWPNIIGDQKNTTWPLSEKNLCR